MTPQTEKDLRAVLDGVAVIIKERDARLNARLELVESKLSALASAEKLAEAMGTIALLQKQCEELQRQADANRRHIANVESKVGKRDYGIR